jgi:hypothetical protein
LEDISRWLSGKCDTIVLEGMELPLVLTKEGCGTKLVDITKILDHAALDAAMRKS